MEQQCLPTPAPSVSQARAFWFLPDHPNDSERTLAEIRFSPDLSWTGQRDDKSVLHTDSFMPERYRRRFPGSTPHQLLLDPFELWGLQGGITEIGACSRSPPHKERSDSQALRASPLRSESAPGFSASLLPSCIAAHF